MGGLAAFFFAAFFRGRLRRAGPAKYTEKGIEKALRTLPPVVVGKRIVVYCAGLFIMALGVSLSVLSNLGVSPMSSIPYVMSQIVPSISMGSFTTGLFCCYVAIQAVLLGSKFHPVRLLQILGSFLFGWFVDITNWLTGLILSQPQRADLLHKGPPLFLCKKQKAPGPPGAGGNIKKKISADVFPCCGCAGGWPQRPPGPGADPVPRNLSAPSPSRPRPPC